MDFSANNNTINNPKDTKQGKNEDCHKKPFRAKENKSLFDRFFAVKVNCLSDTKNAESGRFFPEDFVLEFCAWDNCRFFWFFFVRKDFFVRKEGEDLESIGYSLVDVAGVFN